VATPPEPPPKVFDLWTPLFRVLKYIVSLVLTKHIKNIIIFEKISRGGQNQC
jgi:hypothetical protein